jgi:hypothetical protein
MFGWPKLPTSCEEFLLEFVVNEEETFKKFFHSYVQELCGPSRRLAMTWCLTRR